MDDTPPSGTLTALVTGASVGIGRSFAERLARDGHRVVVVARNRERLEELASRLRRECRVEIDVLAADLTDEDDLARVEQRIREIAALDLLVNNAGFGTHGRFAELPIAGETAEIRLNVLAVVRLARCALPAMIARGRGGIINVSSMASFQPAPFNATYGATKAYVTSFTEALHEELRGTGVRVQALCPGFTRTEFQERAGIDASRLPSVAWMQPEEVVDSSLAALRRDDVVHVPGVANQILSGAAGLVPRSLLRWAGGRLFANLEGGGRGP